MGISGSANKGDRKSKDVTEEAREILEEWKQMDAQQGALTPKQKMAAQKERKRLRKGHTERLSDLQFMQIPKSRNRSWFRMKLGKLLYSDQFELAVGFLVLMNFVIIIIETDINARKEDAPPWLRICNIAFIVMYTVELLARLYVERLQFTENSWNIFDFVIVIIGIAGEFIQGVMDQVSVLRTMRLLRSLRLFRLLAVFPELAALIRDMIRCMRTLMWAFFLLMIAITVWSVFAVELLHPMMAAVNTDGIYEDMDCPWCESAFSSVLKANLTLFQIVTGDGWSLVARPVIEYEAWTSLIFVGVIFTLCFGLLNVVIACMVENAAQGRMNETHMIAMEREETKERAQSVFRKLVKRLDFDGSGEITMEEMKRGVDDIPEFKDLLTVMDVGIEDIDCVFRILDEDKSGGVTHDEFADQLWKMKSQETRTLLTFIKYYVMETWSKVTSKTKKAAEDDLQDFGNKILEAVKTQCALIAEAARTEPKVRKSAKKNTMGEEPKTPTKDIGALPSPSTKPDVVKQAPLVLHHGKVQSESHNPTSFDAFECQDRQTACGDDVHNGFSHDRPGTKGRTASPLETKGDANKADSFTSLFPLDTNAFTPEAEETRSEHQGAYNDKPSTSQVTENSNFAVDKLIPGVVDDASDQRELLLKIASDEKIVSDECAIQV